MAAYLFFQPGRLLRNFFLAWKLFITINTVQFRRVRSFLNLFTFYFIITLDN